MENQEIKLETISNQKLQALLKNPLPVKILEKGKAVNEEYQAYAADELVEFGEDMLCQLAAMGIAAYLQQPKQKESYADYLMTLFAPNSHTPNAGPLFRIVADMILDAEGEQAKLLYPFFWQEKSGKLVLNDDIHHLAQLRNKVMHGFFVLPPEVNREEAEKMADVLESMINKKLFEQNWGTFHFLGEKGFNGNWNISEEGWNLFENCHAFGKLAKRVRFEYSNEFDTEQKEEAAVTSLIQNSELTNTISEFLAKNKKGALAIWHRPADDKGIGGYQFAIQTIAQNEFLPVFYSLNETGITYTFDFLLRKLVQSLADHTKQSKYNKDHREAIKELRKKCTLRPIVILNNIHIGLFNENHVLQLANDLFDLEIPMICFGAHYPYLNRYFNQDFTIVSSAIIPTEAQWRKSLLNYLRFKGPNAEVKNDRKDYELLETILKIMLTVLNDGKQIVARRFADENDFPIEYVQECFAILHPYLNSSIENFEVDEIDELYEFPKEIKESSRIFLGLGRRDIKLEYKHKILSL